jgi:hypothetical protein
MAWNLRNLESDKSDRRNQNMKIDFNPHAAAQAQNARGSQTQTTPPAPDATDDGVEITLSPAAKQMLKTGDAAYDGNSPAHQARQSIADSLAAAAAGDGEVPDLSGPFGQLVKTFAHAKHAPEPEPTDPAPPVDGGDVGDVTEPGDGGDTTATDGTTDGTTDGSGTTDGGDTTTTDGTGTTDGDTGDTGTTEGDGTTVVAAPDDGDGTGIGDTDPAIVVEEPDIAEILDDTAPDDSGPAESGTTEPGTGMAGSGDAVASTGDGETDDGGTTGDTDAPAVVAESGGLTDELIDLLDENSEEVV